MIKRAINRSEISKYKERRQIKAICDFISNADNSFGKILALYGLRRTGKTVLMEQAFVKFSGSIKCAFYEMQNNDNMQMLFDALNSEHESETGVVFIDEITKASDFIENCAVLADVYSKMDLKIVVAGTDSLALVLAANDELLDRMKMVRTTYIPFAEHCEVLGTDDLDEYIEFGGLMRKGGDEYFIYDYNSTCKYLDSAVSNNISGSLLKSCSNSELCKLSKAEMQSIIEKLVELYSGKFNIGVIINALKKASINYPVTKLADLGFPEDVIMPLMSERNNITREFLRQIKADKKITTPFTENMLTELRQFLFDIDVLSTTETVCFDKYNESWEVGPLQKNYYIVQPAIKYNYLKRAAGFIENEKYYLGLSEYQKQLFYNKLDEKIKGDMTEQIILFDIQKSLDSKLYKIVKPEFFVDGQKNGEYDMLIYDKSEDCYWNFEIKHSCAANTEQYRHLVNRDFENIISFHYGRRKNSAVLYNGESFRNTNGIIYLNIKSFLTAAGRSGDFIGVFSELAENLPVKNQEIMPTAGN